MSPSVMTLPARNFKFLTRDQLKEQEIIDVATKIAIDQEAGIGVQVLIRKRTRRRIDGGGPRISRSRAVGAWPGTRNGDNRAREANRRQGHLPSSSLFGWGTDSERVAQRQLFLRQGVPVLSEHSTSRPPIP
jgi:hypothetical protein